MGTIGAKDAVRRGQDSFRVTANVSEPAHLYLIAYLPDGKSFLCYPDPPAASAPARNLVYPREGLMRLNDPGLHVLVLLAARQPLPPYEHWRTGSITWPKNDACAAGAWKFDGQQFSVLSRDLTVAPPVGFKEMCNVFAARREVDAVQAVAFSVPTEPSSTKTEPLQK
jgi:hypothetical protein